MSTPRLTRYVELWEEITRFICSLHLWGQLIHFLVAISGIAMHCTYFVKKSSKNGFVLWIMFIHIKLCSRLHHLQDFHRASVTLNTPVLFPGVVVQHGEKKKGFISIAGYMETH